jgi:hypothetical protein
MHHIWASRNNSGEVVAEHLSMCANNITHLSKNKPDRRIKKDNLKIGGYL